MKDLKINKEIRYCSKNNCYLNCCKIWVNKGNKIINSNSSNCKNKSRKLLKINS